MEYDPADIAVVVIDPQNDVLSASGGSWDMLSASVTENRSCNTASGGSLSRRRMRLLAFPPANALIINGGNCDECSNSGDGRKSSYRFV